MENSGETDTNQVKVELTKDIVKLKMIKPVVSGVAISEQLSIYHPNIKIENVKVRAKKLGISLKNLAVFSLEVLKINLERLEISILLSNRVTTVKMLRLAR